MKTKKTHFQVKIKPAHAVERAVSTLYIAGKITGDPGYFEKFFDAEERLKFEGYTVFNPAALPEGLTKKQYMSLSFAMIDAADGVYLLPDWQESRGARIEREYALYVGKPVYGSVAVTKIGAF